MRAPFRGASFVFLSSRNGASLGRIERRLMKVMEALAEAGADVHFICPPDSPAVALARAAGADVAGYRLTKANYLRTRSRLRKFMLRYHPVVAHSTGFEADVLLRMAAEDLPVKVVNSVHCAAWPRKRTSRSSTTLRKRLDAKTFGRVDVLTADCAWIAEQLAEAGLRVRRVVIDPPSVDLARVYREAEQPLTLPPSKGRWVGYAGRLERTRGLGTLVEAYPRLEAAHPGVRVALAGEGAARAELKHIAKPGVFWLPGNVVSVPAVLSHLDVCCFPSTSPGVPTSLLEAAALGRPIVASRVPGIADLYRDGREIVLVPPGDPEALAAAVAALLDDAGAAAEMGERARLRTVDEYGSSAAVHRYLRLYEKLLA
ncbi:MAG TPA: glycosyltransferase family 4 protein [Coriobacteriia bacterium]|jgi:glycosyltransferase involved in cell wall biosynthesis